MIQFHDPRPRRPDRGVEHFALNATTALLIWQTYPFAGFWLSTFIGTWALVTGRAMIRWIDA